MGVFFLVETSSFSFSFFFSRYCGVSTNTDRTFLDRSSPTAGKTQEEFNGEPIKKVSTNKNADKKTQTKPKRQQSQDNLNMC
jgi:hypothetical protein